MLDFVDHQKLSTQVCRCAICVTMTYCRSYRFQELTLATVCFFPCTQYIFKAILVQRTVRIWPRCHKQQFYNRGKVFFSVALLNQLHWGVARKVPFSCCVIRFVLSTAENKILKKTPSTPQKTLSTTAFEGELNYRC